MESTLGEELGRQFGEELGKALSRIEHCLDQLSDEQLWWRPGADLNSVANLLLHLSGNVRQWLVAGLTGARDTRDRPAEFAAHGAHSKADLWRRLQTTVTEAQAALARQSVDDWLRVRRIQGYEVTGLAAAVGSVTHFQGHTQEIIHMSRVLLGPQYRFAWEPATPEQGAPA